MNAVPEAVDMCVRLMTPQEVATATSVSRLAYDGRSDRPPVDLFATCLLLIFCLESLLHANHWR